MFGSLFSDEPKHSPDLQYHCDKVSFSHPSNFRDILSFLMSLEKVKTMKCFAAAFAIAGIGCFLVMVQFVTSITMVSLESTRLKNFIWKYLRCSARVKICTSQWLGPY
jgi:hypothetical protein